MELKTRLNENEIRNIINRLNFDFRNFYLIRKTRDNKYVYRITLKHNSSVRNKTEYVKKSYYKSKKVNAVCLHGYTLFMIEVFKKDRKAIFRTAFGKVTIDNIKNVYRELRYINVGTAINPLYFFEACFCNDRIIEDVEYELNNLYNR